MGKNLHIREMTEAEKIVLCDWLNSYMSRSNRNKPDILKVIRSNEVVSYMKEVKFFFLVKDFIDKNKKGQEAFSHSGLNFLNHELDRKYVTALFGKSNQSSKLTRILDFREKKQSVEPVAWNYVFHLREYLHEKFGRNPDLQLNNQNYSEDEIDLEVGIYLLKRFSTLYERTISISELRIIALPDYKKSLDPNKEVQYGVKKVAWTYLEQRYGMSDEGHHLTKVKGRILKNGSNFHFIGTGKEYLKNSDVTREFSEDDLIDDKVYESMALKIVSKDRLEGLLISTIRKNGMPFCTKVVADFHSRNFKKDQDVDKFITKLGLHDLSSANDFFDIENGICPEHRMLTL